MTRGGGERALLVGSAVIYVLAWGWLVVGMLASGAWVAASVLVSLLVGLWAVRLGGGRSRFEERAAAATIVAGGLWAVAPAIAVMEPALGRSGWPWQAAALLLIPGILAVRDRERSAAAWLGALGWALGWLPVFLTAALAGGLGGPLAAGYASVYVPLGVLLFVVATVPFAVVAAWTKVIRMWPALLLIPGAILLSGLAGPGVDGPDLQPLVLAGSVAFGAGWVLVGLSLLRPGRWMVDVAP